MSSQQSAKLFTAKVAKDAKKKDILRFCSPLRTLRPCGEALLTADR
jgi:hypothetical protein